MGARGVDVQIRGRVMVALGHCVLQIPVSVLALSFGVSHLTIRSAGQSNTVQTAPRFASTLAGLMDDRYRWDIQTVASKGNVESIRVRSAKASKRAADLLPMIADLKANGAISLHHIATGLNERGIKTARGGEWSAVQVQRILKMAA
jgi:Recombinase